MRAASIVLLALAACGGARERKPGEAVLIDVPEDTEFPIAIAYQQGDRDFLPGDDITLTEVRGTTADFDVGTLFLVKGKYTLQSRDEASLLLSVTATRTGEGKTSGNRRGRLTIRRGSGEFELATEMAFVGYPHVTLYDKPGGQPFGGVYFGKGDSVLADKRFKYSDPGR
jgi:hypothetical protein